MLESIREGVKKPWVKIVIFAIVISFVFAGYFTSSFFLGDPNAVAIVNGESITRDEFQRAYSNVKASQADFYKANVKTEEDERDFQENVLQQLITFKVTEQSINELGLRLSPSALRKVIQSDPNYQVDGNYSSDLVDQTLTRIRMSREGFKRAYENQETARQLTTGLVQTNFSLPQEAGRDFELMSQKRTGRALKIDFEQFKQGLEISEEEINQYYADNQEAFRVEEKVAVEYLELSVEKLQADQHPTDEQIDSYYQDNLGRFKSEEQRQYSHILILSKDNDSAALAKAEAIVERLNKGEDFAEIAKVESDDVPTRDTGGDLGILLAGSLDEPSEEAVKLLTEVSQFTPPVKLDIGYQILKLTKLIEGDQPPLEQVKEELLPELTKVLAEEAFFAKSEKLKEKAFEFSDSLAEAAEDTGLEIQTSALFGRSGREGIFANQLVKDAAFSSDVMEGLLNSEPIEISDNHIVILRLKEHKPSEIQALDAVKDRVTSSLTQTKAKQVAEDLSNELLAKLEASESIDEQLKTHNLTWMDLNKVERNNASLSYAANSAFFKMATPAKGSVTFDKVEDFQGLTILMLTQIEKGNWAEADEANKKQRQLYVSSYFANAEYESYKQNLRNGADVKRNLNNLVQ